MLQKKFVEDVVYGNPEVEELKIQLAAKGAPADDIINDVIDKNIHNPSVNIIVKAVIQALRVEIERRSKEEGRTDFGRFWRKVWSKIFG